jgi:hypothetical protein
MKITIEVTLKRVSGPTCDIETVFEELDQTIDSTSLYPQNPEKDNDSEYEITALKLVTR